VFTLSFLYDVPIKAGQAFGKFITFAKSTPRVSISTRQSFDNLTIDASLNFKIFNRGSGNITTLLAVPLAQIAQAVSYSSNLTRKLSFVDASGFRFFSAGHTAQEGDCLMIDMTGTVSSVNGNSDYGDPRILIEMPVSTILSED